MQVEPSTAILQPKQGKPSFNTNVHGARGLFSFLILVFHVVNSSLATIPVLQTPVADFILRTPEYGVELFFCISGYVITGTLRRARSPAAFLEDRAIRIYPVLIVSTLAIVGLGLLTGTRGYGGLDAATLAWIVPANLLALPGVFPIDKIHPAAWSLSYEVFFYIFCAACWTLRRPLGAALPWLAAPLGLLALLYYPRAIFFVAGVLVAQGWPQRTVLREAVRYPLLFIVLFAGTWRLIQQLTLPEHIIMTTLIEWAMDARLPLAILAFLFAVVGFAGIVSGHGSLGRLLRTQPLQYLGTISYSFYLWHPIVLSGTKMLLLRSSILPMVGDGAQLLLFVVVLPPSLLVSHLSQQLLERRVAVMLRRRLHHAPPQQPPTATGARPPYPG